MNDQSSFSRFFIENSDEYFLATGSSLCIINSIDIILSITQRSDISLSGKTVFLLMRWV